MCLWPTTAAELRLAQSKLAEAAPAPWSLPAAPPAIGGCFVCFQRDTPAAGDRREGAWAGAAVVSAGHVVDRSVAVGSTGHAYEAGLLALREGPLLEAVVRRLSRPPEVLLVNATGRDHPRRSGLALHLGAVVDMPTVGVTHRPLLADGRWPAQERGARSSLHVGDEVVGCWLRVQRGVRPLAVHPAWRTDVDTACAVVLAAAPRVRAPEPLREARRLARTARAAAP